MYEPPNLIFPLYEPNFISTIPNLHSFLMTDNLPIFVTLPEEFTNKQS